MTERQKLHKKLWKLFSEYVRRKEKGKCYTCGIQKEWKETQAGHYKHNVLDFDEMNVHCQCIKCNHFLSGNGSEYALHLLRDYGQEKLEDLHNRAKMALGGERREASWYLEKIEECKEKIKFL